MSNLSFGFGAGYSCFGSNCSMDSDNTATSASANDLIPAGSLTKSFTAASIMRLIDAGELEIDAPVAPLVDKFLLRANGTTLQELWAGNKDNRSAAHITSITVQQLLHMNTGLVG